MASVVVTGATGRIGRAVVRVLRRAGHAVTEVARSCGHGGNRVGLDLRRRVEGLAPADWVVHLAGGYAGASLSELRRQDEAIARNVLDWGLGAGVRNWVVASAAEVYGPAADPVSEEVIPSPRIPYGVVKLAVERQFEAAVSQRDVRAAVLRIAEVYGRGARLVNELAGRFERGFCPWFGRGDVALSFVHVEDVARTCERVLALAPEGLSIWNVADDVPATWREFIDEFARLMNARPPVALPAPVSRLYAALSTATDRLRRRQPVVTQPIVTLLTTPKVLSNRRMRECLGVLPRFPDCRKGLASVLAGHCESEE